MENTSPLSEDDQMMRLAGNACVQNRGSDLELCARPGKVTDTGKQRHDTRNAIKIPTVDDRQTPSSCGSLSEAESDGEISDNSSAILVGITVDDATTDNDQTEIRREETSLQDREENVSTVFGQVNHHPIIRRQSTLPVFNTEMSRQSTVSELESVLEIGYKESDSGETPNVDKRHGYNSEKKDIFDLPAAQRTGSTDEHGGKLRASLAKIDRMTRLKDDVDTYISKTSPPTSALRNRQVKFVETASRWNSFGSSSLKKTGSECEDTSINNTLQKKLSFGPSSEGSTLSDAQSSGSRTFAGILRKRLHMQTLFDKSANDGISRKEKTEQKSGGWDMVVNHVLKITENTTTTVSVSRSIQEALLGMGLEKPNPQAPKKPKKRSKIQVIVRLMSRLSGFKPEKKGPLTLSLDIPDPDITHVEVLRSVKHVLQKVAGTRVQAIQFVDRNVLLGTCNLPGRWIITLNCYAAREELNRLGIVMKERHYTFRDYDDLVVMEHKEQLDLLLKESTRIRGKGFSRKTVKRTRVATASAKVATKPKKVLSRRISTLPDHIEET